MRIALSILALALTAACGGAGGSMGPSLTVQSVDAVSASPDRSFAGMLNAVRAVNGANPVSYDGELYIAAQGHATDMFNQNYFSHVSLDGRELDDRVNATNYNWSALGENIAKGYPDEETVLVGWVNSTGHQANNVNPVFEDFALAKAGSGANQYWVLVLGAKAP